MSHKVSTKKNTLLPIQELQSDFTGRLAAPTDADYDQLRTVFYGGIDQKPAVIILAENASDVQKAIALAHSRKLELCVRSGGHSFAGYSVCEGGIVVDLRKMKAFEIDVEKQTAWAETGLTAGEFTKLADKHNFAVGFGDTGSVGIGGITLGGGIGFLVRKYGLTIDNLLAAEIVTADGELLEVNSQKHPDLFWAIRGGGGNFGVVTRFKFQLHTVNEVVGGMLILPAEPAVLSRFMAEATKAPNELSAIINVMPAPPMPFLPAEHHGKLIIMAMMMYVGDPESGEKVLAPFRAIAKPLADTLKPMRYLEIFGPEDTSYHPTAAAQNMFMKTVDTEIAQIIIDRLRDSDATMRVVQLRALGGKFGQVANEATAFAHRTNQIMVNIAAFYVGPEDQQVREAWVADFAKLLNQGYSGAYVGFVGKRDAVSTHAAYPKRTWERLVEIKRRYDPTNFFHHNQNIDATESNTL
jgi:FAD/FMN-containing dehydrogenase